MKRVLLYIRRRWKRILVYAVLLFAAFVFLLPIWVAIVTSLKPWSEIGVTNPLAPPKSPTLDAYSEALSKLGRPLLNSLIFVSGAVLCSVVIGSWMGYVFSKQRFKYKNILFMVLIAGTFLPYTTIVFPLFRTMSDLGLTFTLPGMVFVHTVYGIPICTLLFRNFYTHIPNDRIEKARKKGASDWEIYRKIILPASKPAIISVMIYQFTSIWNDFLFGLVLGGAESQAMPVTVGLFGMMGGLGRWNLLMAGVILTVLPLLVIYALLHRYFMMAIVEEEEEELPKKI